MRLGDVSEWCLYMERTAIGDVCEYKLIECETLVAWIVVSDFILRYGTHLVRLYPVRCRGYDTSPVWGLEHLRSGQMSE